MRGRQRSRSSPPGQMGRDQDPPILSTNTCSLPPKRNSGARGKRRARFSVRRRAAPGCGCGLPHCAELAPLLRDTCGALLDHELAKAELKTLMPEDAKQQSGTACGPSARNQAR